MTVSATAADGVTKGPLPALLAGVALSTALNALGVFSEDEIHWVNLAVGFVIALVAAAILFPVVRWASHRSGRAWKAGVVLGLLALLLVPAFWSGLPPVLAASAIYLGARRRWSKGGIAAVALGVVAVVGDIALYLGDVASRL